MSSSDENDLDFLPEVLETDEEGFLPEGLFDGDQLPAQTGEKDSGFEGLGELLIREKVISPAQLADATEEIRRSGGKLGYALAQLG